MTSGGIRDSSADRSPVCRRNRRFQQRTVPVHGKFHNPSPQFRNKDCGKSSIFNAVGVLKLLPDNFLNPDFLPLRSRRIHHIRPEILFMDFPIPFQSGAQFFRIFRPNHRIAPCDALKRKSRFPKFTAQFKLAPSPQINPDRDGAFSKSYRLPEHLLPIRHDDEADIRGTSAVFRMTFLVDSDHGGEGVCRPVQIINDTESGMSAKPFSEFNSTDGNRSVARKIGVDLRELVPILCPAPCGIGPRQSLQSDFRTRTGQSGKQKHSRGYSTPFKTENGHFPDSIR